MNEKIEGSNTIKGERHFSYEFQEYLSNKFCLKNNKTKSIQDTSYLKSWTKYCAQSPIIGSMNVLKKCYPQLNFPIEFGINKTENYINSVLKGNFQGNTNENVLQLINPDKVKISIYNSFAGSIPIIEIPNNQDFIRIVQVLLYKNNPTSIPLSMGALLLNGINNWDRINTLKEEWGFPIEIGQNDFFIRLQENPDLFKDKLIILSKKPYSNISAERLNLDSEDWLSLSYKIRLEHECTHLYTLIKYGTASNNLHDELIADYIGISKALGYFDKNWMLEFLGIEEYPKYRKGGRLENYIIHLNLSSQEFEDLIHIIYHAILNLDIFDKTLGPIQSEIDKKNRINSLCEINLLDISSEMGYDQLLKRYNLFELTNVG